jgi:hypothetical protein
MTRAPALSPAGDVIKHANNRLTAGFLYVGPAMQKLQAKALYGS